MARVYVDPLPSWDDAINLQQSALDFFERSGHHTPYMLFINGLHTAFRFRELQAFQWHHYETGNIRLKESKTGKHREVYMSKDFRKKVDYIRERINPDPDDFVHVSKQGNVITLRTAIDYLAKHCKLIGVHQNVATHTLRKTWAREMYIRLGKNDNALQEVSTMLNHEDTGMTRTYLGMSINSDSIKKNYMLI